MIPIILSGGSGIRLWPLSRTTCPKQFLPLVGQNTLFQETCLRLPEELMKNPIIVCNEEHRFIAAHQLHDIGVDANTIMLEPFGRNTAPAVTIAALHIEAQGQDEILAVLPADHIIHDTSSFQAALISGEKEAKKGKIVTFGIMPTSPQTGFGYIEAKNKNPEGSDINSFKEKPDVVTAEQYLRSGKYYWNSGIFMFSTKVFLSEIRKHAPDIYKSCRDAYSHITKDIDFLRINAKNFINCRSESIDYAIMEKTNKAHVIPLDAGWNDLGSWPAVFDTKIHKKNENVIEGDVIQHDCKGSYFYSDNKLITAIGLEGFIVVDTLDALLVAPKERAQEVKNIVSELIEKDRQEATIHRMVHRPWGTYDSVDIGEGYQVKRITVYPRQKLSLQKHFHRSEHWVVVKGMAKVTCDDEVFLIKENESTYIPVGSVHSLENKNNTPLILIEVQTGNYLGEDDIERFEDLYGRDVNSKTP
ncbi:mannose-1-phosphate guanylyltransferase/mannose-6-phosphate isomerase [Emcibacteraceae bacterium]|nr:mannose-1-phosphate guanylyltransferase/mannose-6-phosphate isomerase [Emcibacteraceae bacterium]